MIGGFITESIYLVLVVETDRLMILAIMLSLLYFATTMLHCYNDVLTYVITTTMPHCYNNALTCVITTTMLHCDNDVLTYVIKIGVTSIGLIKTNAVYKMNPNSLLHPLHLVSCQIESQIYQIIQSCCYTVSWTWIPFSSLKKEKLLPK